MTVDQIKRLQSRIGVAPDGIIGRGTLAMLFAKAGANPERAASLALGANVHFRTHAILETGLRLAHFMAQVGHESGGFRYMEEIWGPTAAQKRYEGRQDLGNVQPGDGFRFKGRGPLQLTGRANYRRFGHKIGIDLEANPEIAAIPSIGILIACVYWTDRDLNELADRDDVEKITRRVNGGLNGFDDRKARLSKMKALLA